jgi:hypothetical protein
MRRVISPLALVKVTARICAAGMFLAAIRCTPAAVSGLVLPVPAAATTRTGPIAVAGCSCGGVRSERIVAEAAGELQDFNMAVVPVTDEDLLVSCEHREIGIEVPLTVGVALAIDHDALDQLRPVMRLGTDVGV